MARTRQRVSFAKPEGVRDPLPDERSVLRDFTRHIGKCSTCKYSLYSESGTFCSRGMCRFTEMSPYFFLSRGKPYSKLDEDRDMRTRVMIPQEFEPATHFFEALYRGFDPRAPARAPIIHNTTPRSIPRVRDYDRSAPVIISASPDSGRTPRDRYSERRRDTAYHAPAGRGSLYYQDEARRQARPSYERIVVAPTDYVYYRRL